MCRPTNIPETWLNIAAEKSSFVAEAAVVAIKEDIGSPSRARTLVTISVSASAQDTENPLATSETGQSLAYKGHVAMSVYQNKGNAKAPEYANQGTMRAIGGIETLRSTFKTGRSSIGRSEHFSP